MFEFYPKEWVQMISDRCMVGIIDALLDTINGVIDSDNINTSKFSTDEYIEFVDKHFEGYHILKAMKQSFHSIPAVCMMRRKCQMNLLSQVELLNNYLYDNIHESNFREKFTYMASYREYEKIPFELFLHIVEQVSEAIVIYLKEYMDNSDDYSAVEV